MPSESSVILLYGNNEYLIRQRLAAFETMFSDPTTASMNTARLEGRAVSEDDLNNAVNAMPFLAKQRLVLFWKASERYTTPESRKKFCEFLEKVPTTTKLVLIEAVDLKWRPTKEKQEEEDDRNWPVKWFRKHGLSLERCALPTQRDMPGWIVKEAQDQGGQIDRAGAAKLAEMVGSNTQQAAQEVGKLLAFANWTRPISMQDVQAVSIVTAEADVYKMVDELVLGHGGAAQRMMRKLLQDEGAFSVWPMVIRQFRFLLVAREVLDHNGGPQEVLEALLTVQPRPPRPQLFMAEKASNQAKRFSMTALERVYHKLLDIDVAAKTGGMPLEVSMEMLVTELTA